MPNKKSAVGVVAKPSQPRAVSAAEELIEKLEKRKIDFWIDSEVARRSRALSKRSRRVLKRAEIASRADIVVVLGGDGTFISVAHFPLKVPPILLGVNLGTLGFLTELTLEELWPTLELTLAGEAKVESRSLLSAAVSSKGKKGPTFYALNDIVVSKEAIARIFTTAVYVDGVLAANIRGDGVIISTPLGSTAYSLAAGGSIVHPGVEALLITPICPHSLTSRPLVVPGSSEIRLVIEPGESPAQTEVFLTSDGQEGVSAVSGDTVSVQTSPHLVRFVRSPTRSYYQLLGSKLKWAQRNQ